MVIDCFLGCVDAGGIQGRSSIEKWSLNDSRPDLGHSREKVSHKQPVEVNVRLDLVRHLGMNL